MQLFKPEDPRTDRAFLFYPELPPSVVVRAWRFRSEEEYDRETQPEATALRLLQRVIACTRKKSYVVTVSDLDKSSPLRSKKGVLWEWRHSVLPKLCRRSFEVHAATGSSRLAAIIELTDFSFDAWPDVILNWYYGLIVLTDMPFDDMAGEIEKWISTNPRKALGYDYEALGDSLNKCKDIAALRYFPADNGMHETIAIVSNEAFMADEVEGCICTLEKAVESRG